MKMKKKKLIWHNIKVYNHNTILNRIAFIQDNMLGLLPIYGHEKVVLKKYAEKNGIAVSELFSMRNMIKIQSEIVSSRKFHFYENKIVYKLNNLIKGLLESSDRQKNKAMIRHYLKTINMPFGQIYRTILKIPTYHDLHHTNKDYFNQISELIREKEHISKENSVAFEHMLENYFRQNNIAFKTETDIKNENAGNYVATPDLLLDEELVLELDNIQYKIKWIDAKNYMLIDIPFIMKSLNKQSAKYNAIFGQGAFVFHYGLDSSIKIDGAVLLDGSFL